MFHIIFKDKRSGQSLNLEGFALSTAERDEISNSTGS